MERNRADKEVERILAVEWSERMHVVVHDAVEQDVAVGADEGACNRGHERDVIGDGKISLE